MHTPEHIAGMMRQPQSKLHLWFPSHDQHGWLNCIVPGFCKAASTQPLTGPSEVPRWCRFLQSVAAYALALSAQLRHVSWPFYETAPIRSLRGSGRGHLSISSSQHDAAIMGQYP